MYVYIYTYPYIYNIYGFIYMVIDLVIIYSVYIGLELG